MNKKKVLITSAIVTAFLASASTVSGILLTNKLMYIPPKNIHFTHRREKRAHRYDENWFDNCPRTELYIDSPNGYMIRGTFYQPLVTTNTVIISHGVTENKINSMKYVRMYERLGYNTVVYDHRRHGESGGATTSYGYYEKLDMKAVVDEVRMIIGEHAVLGIHGESMGAATTLLYGGMVHDNADFYISDCAFSEFKQLLRKIVKETISIQLEMAVVITDLTMRIRDGYHFNAVSPIQAVQNIQKPVLFIHSKHDDFIPSSMAQDLYDAKVNGERELALFEEGEHAQSFNSNPDAYEKCVHKFLTKHVRKNWPTLFGAS
jgi:uncharacterized protein